MTTAYDPTYPADDIYVKDLPAAMRLKGEQIRGAMDATPTGIISAYAGSTAPGGYLMCDGAAVSRETYATLFAVVGATYGGGDGSTTFNVPDLRGQFIQGLASGRTLGSTQESANKSHTHTGSSSAAGGHTHTGSSSAAGAHSHSGNTGAQSVNHFHGYIRAVLTFMGWAAARLKVGDPAWQVYSPSDQNESTGGINENHTHSFSTSEVAAHSHSMSLNAVGNHSHEMALNSEGATDARPKNIALNYIIKV
ncbi:MAG: hypothetical protein EOM17_11565 [Synergistales bacterium]|nr:hypothetical protein [Synergistales bacterium]